MSAVSGTGTSTGAVSAARMSTRRAALVLGAVVIAFAAAFAIGSMSKTSTTATPLGQLAPVSALHGQSSVQIAAPGAAGAIPSLAQAAKPKPAQHKVATASTSTTTQASSSPTSSSSSTSSQTVTRQPVVQQPVVQRPVVQTPVTHPQPQQPVVVVHGG